MEFKGSAIRLAPNDVAEAAALIGVTEAHMRTVMEVETNGHGFDAYGRPEILFERHKFYAYLSGGERAQAVKQGLAYPHWGQKPYPKTASLRWSEFQRACAIDETAAIKSTSWGLGQIMGSEYEEAGFDSPQEMVTAFFQSEREQVIGMAKLIQKRGLNKVMMGFPSMEACARFALRYNGSGYRKNRYDTKLHDAFVRWSARQKANQPMHDDGVLRMGSRGDRVKALQEALDKRGYIGGKIDGIYGNRTRDLVLAWQADNNMECDGTMDANDLAALDKSPDRPISEERADADTTDVAKDSTIVQNSNTATNVIKGGGTILAVAEGSDKMGLLDNALDQSQGVVDKANQAKGLWESAHDLLQSTGIASALKFVQAHEVLFLCVGGFAIWYIVHKIRAARVEMHRTGEAQ